MSVKKLNFFWSFGITVIFCLILIFSANIIINPRSDFSTHIFKPLVKDDRKEKIDLLLEYKNPPEILIFGSSRSMKINPGVVNKLTNQSCFNAAVNSARTEDYYAILSYLASRKRLPEKIILGIDIEALHDNLDMDYRLINEKRLYNQISKQNMFFENLKKIFKTLDQKYVIDDLKVIQYSLKGYPMPISHFEKNGFLIYDRWEMQMRENTFDLDSEIRKSVPSYILRFKNMTGLSEERKKYFENFLNIAKENNITVYIFITTIHDKGIFVLENKTLFKELRIETNEYLSETGKKYGFEFKDFSDTASYNGNQNGFFDVGHIDEENSMKIVKLLLEEKKGENIVIQ